MAFYVTTAAAATFTVKEANYPRRQCAQKKYKQKTAINFVGKTDRRDIYNSHYLLCIDNNIG